jgi:uncharacterized protein DUF4331
MRRLRTTLLVAGLVLLLFIAVVLAPATRLRAADHGDAPLTAHDLGADLNDVYMFRDPNDNSRLILIMTVHGFIVPGEASNFGIFDPALRYRFEMETTGDARADGAIDVSRKHKQQPSTCPTAECSLRPQQTRATLPTSHQHLYSLQILRAG